MKRIIKTISNFFKLVAHFIFNRLTLAILALAIQCFLLYYVYTLFYDHLFVYYGFTGVLSILLVIYLLSQNKNYDFNLAWIILILAVPAFGCLFYFFCKIEGEFNSYKVRLAKRKEENYRYLPQDNKALNELKDSDMIQHANYLYRVGHFPIYPIQNIEYFKVGEEWYKDVLEKLKNAKKYIFLEFFIIRDDEMWNQILEILKDKVKEGVKVRVLYDGTCTFRHLPHNYPRILETFGIECKVYSPIVPVISTQYNNRDHRKIIVIDGNIGYTGGINMGNEYINHPSLFHYWKDNMVRIEGNAVNSLLILFLEMWNIDQKKSIENYQEYMTHNECKNMGYIVPFGDDPLDDETVGKRCYMNLLESATESVDIMTPYFLVDHELFQCLIQTAKKGIRVRVLLPGVPDKMYMSLLAHTYYQDMVENGIELYEYTPGFCHGKIMVKDNDEAIVGTINLDYRSLYLHFEDALLIMKHKEIETIKKDLEDTFHKSHRVTIRNVVDYSKFKLFLGEVLRLFSPLF